MEDRPSRAVSLAQDSFERIGKEVESNYRAERADSAELLNNALVMVIQGQQATIETTLYVLEMIKLNLCTQMAKVNREDSGPGVPARVPPMVWVPEVGPDPAPALMEPEEPEPTEPTEPTEPEPEPEEPEPVEPVEPVVAVKDIAKARGKKPGAIGE